MFAHSFNARLLWKEKTGQAMRTHSDTRWWSEWDILQQALCYFGDIEPFPRENEEMSPAMHRHLQPLYIVEVLTCRTGFFFFFRVLPVNANRTRSARYARSEKARKNKRTFPRVSRVPRTLCVHLKTATK